MSESFVTEDSTPREYCDRNIEQSGGASLNKYDDR